MTRKTKRSVSKRQDSRRTEFKKNEFAAAARLPSRFLKKAGIKSAANPMDDALVWSSVVFSIVFCGLKGFVVAPTLVAAAYLHPEFIRVPAILNNFQRKEVEDEQHQ